jgi:hypothetical protein
MVRATHGFLFGVLLVLAGWGTAAWLSLAATRPSPPAAASPAASPAPGAPAFDGAAARPLWQLYERTLKRAKYVDLTHAITPWIDPARGSRSRSRPSAASPRAPARGPAARRRARPAPGCRGRPAARRSGGRSGRHQRRHAQDGGAQQADLAFEGEQLLGAAAPRQRPEAGAAPSCQDQDAHAGTSRRGTRRGIAASPKFPGQF